MEGHRSLLFYSLIMKGDKMNIVTTNASDYNANIFAMSKMDKLYNDMAEVVSQFEFSN